VQDPSFDVTPLLLNPQAPALLISPDSAGPLITLEEQDLIRDTIPRCEQVVFEGGGATLPCVAAESCPSDSRVPPAPRPPAAPSSALPQIRPA
jgi:hypothetical protein